MLFSLRLPKVDPQDPEFSRQAEYFFALAKKPPEKSASRKTARKKTAVVAAVICEC